MIAREKTSMTATLIACSVFAGCSTFTSKKPEGFTAQDRKFFKEAETTIDGPPRATPGKERESFLAMGQFYLEVKRLPLAERMFEKAIAADPKCVGAYAGLAKCHSEAGKTDKAADALNKGFAVDPKSAILWNEAAVLRAKTGDLEGAVEAADRAVAAAPNVMLYKENFGNMLAVTGHYKQAYEVYSKALNPAEAYYRIALALKDKGDLRACDKQLRQALEQDPEHAASRRLLAQMNAAATKRAPVQQAAYETSEEAEAAVEQAVERRTRRPAKSKNSEWKAKRPSTTEEEEQQ